MRTASRSGSSIASTSEVYGDHRERTPLPEDARRVYGPTTTRRWAYADSKAMDELLALAYHQERGLDCVIARLFNTVGPRQSGQYGMVIPRFVERALAGEPLEIHGDGTQTRCFCHVADTVRALSSLMDSAATSGEIYNVGSQQPISILDLAKRVLEMTRSSSELSYVPYGEVYGLGIEDMHHRVPATEKIARRGRLAGDARPRRRPRRRDQAPAHGRAGRRQRPASARAGGGPLGREHAFDRAHGERVSGERRRDRHAPLDERPLRKRERDRDADHDRRHNEAGHAERAQAAEPPGAPEVRVLADQRNDDEGHNGQDPHDPHTLTMARTGLPVQVRAVKWHRWRSRWRPSRSCGARLSPTSTRTSSS